MESMVGTTTVRPLSQEIFEMVS